MEYCEKVFRSEETRIKCSSSVIVSGAKQVPALGVGLSAATCVLLFSQGNHKVTIPIMFIDVQSKVILYSLEAAE